MSKWWHILASIGLAALGVLAPPVQGAIAAHPIVSTVLAAVWGVLGNLLQSPIKPPAQ